jgi:hypothetical protein
MSKFIWDISRKKKVKIKEIREYNIVKNEDFGGFDVRVFGFFGGGVVIFHNDDEGRCQQFINEMTEEGGEK